MLLISAIRRGVRMSSGLGRLEVKFGGADRESLATVESRQAAGGAHLIPGVRHDAALSIEEIGAILGELGAEAIRPNDELRPVSAVDGHAPNWMKNQGSIE